MSSNRRDCYNLSGFDDYNYLNNKYIDCKTFNDKDEFELTLKAFKIMGFSNEIVNKILKIIASILHLGNITFTKEYFIAVDVFVLISFEPLNPVQPSVQESHMQ